MIHPSRPLLAALALGCMGVATRGTAQTEIAKTSPFTAANAPAAASAPGEVIEFAAVRTIGKNTEVDLYDTQGKKNHWIPVGGTADGMTVVGYDARRDQVTAKIGGVNKVLTLRQTRGVVAGAAAVTSTAMSFATPDASGPKTPWPAPDSASAALVTGAAANLPASVTPAAATPPAQPAIPLTIARQEEEARMLVSDLLEIGMAQRKAYEEKQKKAADPNAPSAETSATAPTPAPIPNSEKPPGGE